MTIQSNTVKRKKIDIFTTPTEWAEHLFYKKIGFVSGGVYKDYGDGTCKPLCGWAGERWPIPLVVFIPDYKCKGCGRSNESKIEKELDKGKELDLVEWWAHYEGELPDMVKKIMQIFKGEDIYWWWFD